MRDEDHREVEPVVQVVDEVDDRPLGEDVERGRRLVEDQHLRPEQQAHRDEHPLAHSAGELVRIGLEHPVGVELDLLQDLGTRGRGASCLRIDVWCARMVSCIWSQTWSTGLKEFIAPWKTIAHSLHRNRRSCSSLRLEHVDRSNRRGGGR